MAMLRCLGIALIVGWCLDAQVEAQSISGVCRSGGKPIKGIRIYVSGLSKPVVTDREGRYTATVVGPGTFTVTPYPSNSRLVAAPIRRTVDVGGTAANNLDFELSRLDTRAAIRGRIVGADRQPVAGVGVRVGGLGAVVSDANGIYARSDIAPGRYSVTPLKGEMTFIPAVRSQNLVAGRATRISIQGLPLSPGTPVRTDLSGIFDSSLRLASGSCPILPESVEGRAVVYQRDRQARLSLPRLGYSVFEVKPSGFAGTFRKRKLACLIDGELAAVYSSADAASVTGKLKVVCLGTDQCNGTFTGTFTRR